MDNLIETFHIDIKLLIAQAVNFAIVVSVLYYFALRPLMRVMKDREVKIEKSLEDAKKIDERLSQTKDEYKESLTRAKIESARIIKEAHKQAELKKDQMTEAAKIEIGALINKEKAAIGEEKAKVLRDIKKEVAGLVIGGVEKVLSRKIDSQEDRELIKKIVK